MNPKLSLKERDRRWTLIQAAMKAEGLEAIIVGMTDFRGQKGGFRYLSDERPFHRFGYGLMLAGREPILVMHSILAHAPRGLWIEDVRFPAHAGSEMAEVLKAAKATRVGLVEADQVMRVSDHTALAAAGLTLINADAMFDRIRAQKSREEIAGLEEAAAIADDCFETLLDMARPGLRENEICGRLSDVAIAAGAEELLFLTMSGDDRRGCMHAMIRAPGEHVLTASDPLVFSIEVSGPSGFWVELARMIAFQGADPGVAETAALAHASVRSALTMIRDGVTGPDIQAALEKPFDPALHEVSGWSGHAIGHDVIEGPLIGRGADPALPFEQGMAFALHPMFNWRDRPITGYVADTYVIEVEGCRRLSRWPLELYRLQR